MRFLRTAIALAVVASTLVAASGVATAGSDPTGEQYRKYALIRERLTSCSLDRTWHQLGTQARKNCDTYRKLYILWSEPGESYRYHVHCRTAKKCPAPPFGEPNPRAPIPAGSHVFR
jgi:hypothetical protein